MGRARYALRAPQPMLQAPPPMLPAWPVPLELVLAPQGPPAQPVPLALMRQPLAALHAPSAPLDLLPMLLGAHPVLQSHPAWWRFCQARQQAHPAQQGATFLPPLRNAPPALVAPAALLQARSPAPRALHAQQGTTPQCRGQPPACPAQVGRMQVPLGGHLWLPACPARWDSTVLGADPLAPSAQRW